MLKCCSIVAHRLGTAEIIWLIKKNFVLYDRTSFAYYKIYIFLCFMPYALYNMIILKIPFPLISEVYKAINLKYIGSIMRHTFTIYVTTILYKYISKILYYI